MENIDDMLNEIFDDEEEEKDDSGELIDLSLDDENEEIPENEIEGFGFEDEEENEPPVEEEEEPFSEEEKDSIEDFFEEPKEVEIEEEKEEEIEEVKPPKKRGRPRKKDTEKETPKSTKKETQKEVKKEQVKLDDLIDESDFIEEEEDEPETEAPLENSTTLENFPGDTLMVRRFIANDPIPARENIIRYYNGVYELIAVAPSKVIQCSDEDSKLLILDHILKTQEMSDEDKRTILRYEVRRKDLVEKLFGTDDVAKLNNISEDELEVALIDIPPDIMEIIRRLGEELGMEIKITPQIARAKSEAEILKIMLKEKK